MAVACSLEKSVLHNGTSGSSSLFFRGSLPGGEDDTAPHGEPKEHLEEGNADGHDTHPLECILGGQDSWSEEDGLSLQAETQRSDIGQRSPPSLLCASSLLRPFLDTICPIRR